ncbi:hypothetical protein [Amycolatopsis acidiphila]|nr:hypothetical protein [Amycolatopsis acidiphila]
MSSELGSLVLAVEAPPERPRLLAAVKAALLGEDAPAGELAGAAGIIPC